MAEGLFRKLVAERKDIAIQSAGLSAGRGLPASQHAILALSEEGVDLMNFRSKPVSEELVRHATHIFVMTRDHKRLLELFFPEAGEKTSYLLEFEPGSPDVPDPIGLGGNLRTLPRRLEESPTQPSATYRKPTHDHRISLPGPKLHALSRGGRSADCPSHRERAPPPVREYWADRQRELYQQGGDGSPRILPDE
jgi:protein-tyrosine-phosphatase